MKYREAIYFGLSIFSIIALAIIVLFGLGYVIQLQSILAQKYPVIIGFIFVIELILLISIVEVCAFWSEMFPKEKEQ